MTREQVNAHLAGCMWWIPVLRSEAQEAFVAHMMGQRLSAAETQQAWLWFHEGYQTGLVFERMRCLQRAEQ